MIQLRRAPIRKTRSASRSAVLRAAPTESGSSSGMVPLPIGRIQERQLGALDELADLVLRPRPGHALADHHQAAVPPTPSADSAASTASGSACGARRFGHGGRLDDFVLVAFAADDVVGEVEVDGSRATVERVAHRLIDVVRDAVNVLDGMRVLAVRRREFDLALFLEAAHAVLVDRRRAADQDHRPAVLLGVGQGPAKAWMTPGPETVRQACGRPVR